ncbi:MAG: 30S ribosomal protein S17 [Planctomycetes bacterium]|nr:30S ribosomal protein S17 [Planctomycetota bacterium]MBI3846662.1 30S ribosomal protein S17 [Planctomycetota bacterium]
MSERGLRKVEIGIVTSDRMQKTIAVRVERLVQHPIYGKILRRHVTFKAHDEKREAKIGDLVEIMETRPVSKTKTWRLVRVVERSRTEFDPKLGLAPAAILGEAGGANPAS